jgi:competence protein ComEC
MHLRYKILIAIFAALAVFDVSVWIRVADGRFNNDLALYFLDVGQGDSQLIQLPNDVDVLIDGGKDARVLDNLSRVMPAHDRTIDVVVVTHPQLDHFGGLIDVIERYDVGVVLGNGRVAESESYAQFIDVLRARDVGYLAVGAGDVVRYGDYAFNVLSPALARLTQSEDLNDTSLVIKLHSPAFSALYTGDIGFAVEEWLLEDDIQADILKIPHHGSKYSSSRTFLATVAPVVSVISVGKNSYGHPTYDTLSRIEAIKSTLYRTDEQGIVKITTEDGVLQIFTEITPY